MSSSICSIGVSSGISLEDSPIIPPAVSLEVASGFPVEVFSGYPEEVHSYWNCFGNYS